MSGDLLLWIKALHVIAAFAWMAGLFYLPRLFVYHAGTLPGSEMSELFKTMERRLLNAIMRPAMIAVWVLGLVSAYLGGLFSGFEPWFAVKFVAVLAMSAFHGRLERHRREFASDLRVRDGRYFRIINEVPTVLLIVIVIMVIVRPF
ncbi:MAG: protoporphyrinogen oxidase HemJ [Rhizobiales bacterium]|nr:protoporphyrinogen oxidase HemJ [Hyphomicrobiales bacterium]